MTYVSLIKYLSNVYVVQSDISLNFTCLQVLFQKWFQFLKIYFTDKGNFLVRCLFISTRHFLKRKQKNFNLMQTNPT